jgi:HEPN domain-containing protein
MIDDYIEKWIIKAVNDLKLAEHELRQPEDEIVTDAICFHCQQAVEKLLKAYLASKNIDTLMNFTCRLLPKLKNVSV